MTKPVISKLLDIITVSTDALKKKGIDDARLNVELIMCHVLECDRLKLYLDFEKPLNETEKDKARKFLKRRLNHEPLQYILGETEFYKYRFKVDQNVLIPRPETELLVEHCIKLIKKSGKQDIVIVEAGTGTGCVSISLAKELEELGINYEIESYDISPLAIEIAIENMKLNNVKGSKINFIKKDFLRLESLNPETDFLISNPPYINSKDYELLAPEIKNFEPRSALTDGSDGMTFFRKFIELRKNSGKKLTVITEIAYDQFEKLTSLLKDNCLSDFRFVKDYSGINRIAEF